MPQPKKTAAKTDAPRMRVLFADDEAPLQELMRAELPRMGYAATICPDGETACAVIDREPIDCMILDINMPGRSGIEVLQYAREVRPEVDVVIYTGRPSTETAIDAVRGGAVDYLVKPCKLHELATLLGRIAERRTLRRQVAALQRRVAQTSGEAKLIGSDPAIERLREMIDKVAPSDAAVMIQGETGCGKELVARGIHDASHRRAAPMVAVNCGALPETLIESELFGHRKGAFTGADQARTGLFEVADGGTLFLDEVGELPLPVQAKLLRVLETGDIRPLGGNQTIHVDVRIVCATHRDLDQMVADGAFREDLMFRINTFELTVPPLRRRLGDLAELAEHLLRRHRPAAQPGRGFTDAALAALKEHAWPGNVRELANVVEHAAILCQDLPIDAEDLPVRLGRRELRPALQNAEPMKLKELERIAIDRAMARHGGNKTAAAEELGVSVKTLYNRLNVGTTEAA